MESTRKYLSLIVLIITTMPAITYGASVTITGPTTLQTQFIADTTNLYNATITPNAFFPGSYTVNLISKKPVIPQGPVPCTVDQNLQVLISTVTAIAKGNYVYCYAAGEEDERARNLTTLDGYGLSCGTTTLCSGTIKSAHDAIFLQNLSAPPAP